MHKELIPLKTLQDELERPQHSEVVQASNHKGKRGKAAPCGSGGEDIGTAIRILPSGQ